MSAIDFVGVDCPSCGTSVVIFAVPVEHREASPEGGDLAAICPACLTLAAVDPTDVARTDVPAPEFSRIIDGFPPNEVGATTALAVGLLVESLALNRDTVGRLFDDIADEGIDPWLVLERLAEAPSVQPDVHLRKLGNQLEQLWG